MEDRSTNSRAFIRLRALTPAAASWPSHITKFRDCLPAPANRPFLSPEGGSVEGAPKATITVKAGATQYRMSIGIIGSQHKIKRRTLPIPSALPCRTVNKEVIEPDQA